MNNLVIWHQVFLFNIIWLIDGILTGTTIPDQSGPGSNSNEEIFHIFKISRTGNSPLDAL